MTEEKVLSLVMLWVSNNEILFNKRLVSYTKDMYS